MTDRDFDGPDEDEPVVLGGEEEVIDFAIDPVEVRQEDEEGLEASPSFSDEEYRRIENAELDDLLDEFVDVVNARDPEGLAELLALDVEAEFLRESSRDGVVGGFNDLFLRYPTLLTSRGDIGSDPIVVMWIFDREANRFDPFGYVSFDLDDATNSLIQRIDFIDELPDSDDLVVETPEASELAEWEDWSQLDED